MTKENRELNFVKIEASGFQDLCNKIRKLENDLEEVCIHEEMLLKENRELKARNEFLERMTNGVKLNNSKLTLERNELINELQSIKSLSMFEFASRYCSEEEQGNAGRAFARELLGKPMTPEEVAIDEAENRYDYYTGDDF